MLSRSQRRFFELKSVRFVSMCMPDRSLVHSHLALLLTASPLGSQLSNSACIRICSENGEEADECDVFLRYFHEEEQCNGIVSNKLLVVDCRRRVERLTFLDRRGRAYLSVPVKGDKGEMILAASTPEEATQAKNEMNALLITVEAFRNKDPNGSESSSHGSATVRSQASDAGSFERAVSSECQSSVVLSASGYEDGNLDTQLPRLSRTRSDPPTHTVNFHSAHFFNSSDGTLIQTPFSSSPSSRLARLRGLALRLSDEACEADHGGFTRSKSAGSPNRAGPSELLHRAGSSEEDAVLSHVDDPRAAMSQAAMRLSVRFCGSYEGRMSFRDPRRGRPKEILPSCVENGSRYGCHSDENGSRHGCDEKG